MKLKKGDTVLITKGKYRTRKGKVIRVFPQESRVLIEGVNIIKKHVRPKRSGEKGQVVEMPAPIHISKMKLVCKDCGKATKVGYKIVGKEKYRICKKCGKEM